LLRRVFRVWVFLCSDLLRFDELKIGHILPFEKGGTVHENGDQCDVKWCLT